MEGFPSLNIYGIGRNFSFVMRELIMIDFFIFQKKIFQNLVSLLEQDK